MKEESLPMARNKSHRAAGLVVIAVGVAACGQEAQRAAVEARSVPPQAVQTVVVQDGGSDGTTAVAATVMARQRAALASRIPASVVELPWREGDRVAAGTVVARLDDVALRSGLLAAESAARAADVDLARVETLLKKGAATPKEAEESRARAAAAGAAVASARDNLAYAVLRSPFEGTLASRPTNVGDVVQPGTTIVEIEGKGGLEVRATVEADVVSRLRVGVPLVALVDGQPQPLTATVRAVSASGDPATHRFEVRADLPTAPGLRSGVFARLLVPSPGGGARLTVPTSAVFPRGGLHGLFVVAESRAHLRWVAVGATEGDLVEVRAGVETGERVVVNPAGLVDGQPVTEAMPGAR
jgi:RND family efflux transporter MFP subunit